MYIGFGEQLLSAIDAGLLGWFICRFLHPGFKVVRGRDYSVVGDVVVIVANKLFLFLTHSSENAIIRVEVSLLGYRHRSHFIRFVINFNLILLNISILIIELKYFVMNLQTIFIFE